MTDIKIPHAERTFVEQDPPREILHVVTGLVEHPAEPGFDAGAKHDMMKAIANTVGDRRLDGYVVHWARQANT